MPKTITHPCCSCSALICIIVLVAAVSLMEDLNFLLNLCCCLNQLHHILCYAHSVAAQLRYKASFYVSVFFYPFSFYA